MLEQQLLQMQQLTNKGTTTLESLAIKLFSRKPSRITPTTFKMLLLSAMVFTFTLWRLRI